MIHNIHFNPSFQKEALMADKRDLDRADEGGETTLIRWGGDAFVNRMLGILAPFLKETKQGYIINAVKKSLREDAYLIQGAIEALTDGLGKLEKEVGDLEAERHVIKAIRSYCTDNDVDFRKLLERFRKEITQNAA